MKLHEAKISILIGRDSTTIELIDATSSITFARVKLTPEQLSSALSRVAHTDCEIEVFGLDRLNKRLEVQRIFFELPKELQGYGNRDINKIHQLALAHCPEGWTPDKYYGSKESFFQKDGKYYASANTRRWVELPDDAVSDTTEAT